MNRVDELIGQALSDEDRALLARHGEPGYMTQAFGLFRGPLAWVMWLVYVLGALSFVAGAYAAWQMVTSSDVLMAVKWGVGALLLLQLSTLFKSFMGSHMETNRMLREIKRVELQVSMLQPGLGREVGR